MIAKLKALTQNQNIMRYVKNSSWMLAEYGLKIISAIFVSIYVARYLGPEQFGLLSYALAIVAIASTVSRLGMESILVRDIAKYPEQQQAYLGTAFTLMLIAAITGVVMLSGIIYWLETDPKTQLYIWIIAVGILFQTFLAIDYNFQAQVKAKYSSIAKSVALGIGAIIKIYLVWTQAELWLFATAYAVDTAIIAATLLITHWLNKQPNFIGVFRREIVKPMLVSAWPMILAAVAAMLYMRIDQIMIKNMLGAEELGLYAAATKIYEGWIIVPYVISISLLPAIVKLKSSSQQSYEANLSRLFAIVIWSGVFVALIATLFGESIIYYTFGREFIEASQVLAIVMWSGAFTAIGSVTARYLTVEGMEKKIAIRTFVGLFLNVLLNLLLIPIYGIEGAAVATLLTIVIANYFINYVDKDLKQLRIICNNAIVLRLKTKP
jgi:O-antigen/teichoic acid export membrane protein